MNQSPQVHFRTDNFSLEAWVFPEAINNTIQHIIANHTIRPISGVENMGGYRLYMLSGKLYLQMGDYSGALASGGCAQIRTVNTISASEWHHIIAVRNGNSAANFKIYVDGTLQQTEVADYSYLNNGNVYNESNSGRLVYGNRSGSGVGESFIGFIKNVKIYKKVMTDAEALANYTSCSGAPADTTNLVLWTRLENGSGTVVSDSSRFATNGLMTTGAGWGGGVGIATNANCIGEKEGVLCVTRTLTVPVVKGYKYEFNGKENDNEVKGEGNQQDYGFRIYDPRISRFLSTDPLTQEYPWYTPYQFGGNNPIEFIDRDGLEPAKKGVINAATPDEVATNPISSGIQNGLFNVASAFGLNALDDLSADLTDAIKGNQTWSQAGRGMLNTLSDVKNNISPIPVQGLSSGGRGLAPVAVSDGQTLVVTQGAVAAPVISNPSAVVVLMNATKPTNAASKKGGVGPNNVGKAGGKLGGEDASKTPYVGPVSGKNRLSDINIPGKVLGEIKNNLNYVQWLSTQIKDGLAEALKNGQEYILKMANPDKITKPLKNAIESQGGKGAKVTNIDALH